ncbi:polymer-forming cytoskeletal protein [Candidatus Kuenenbacteria bacterium]|nr:polymer-forming cytoskeletal protein [Candidatus Kuenenbacteria bacterium]
MKKIIFFFIFSCFLLLSHSSAQAIVQKTGENIYLNSSEIIEDDLIAFGEIIEINGLIKGDLFVVGQIITINGNVEGDIIGLGQQITINGKVNGNVRILGQTIKFNNQVDKNINVFGESIFFSEKSKVEKNLLILGENIEINGKVNGNIYGNGEKISLNNEINKIINLNVTSLVLQSNAIINGDLYYRAPQKAKIQSGAQISGKTFYKIPSFEKKEKKYTITFFFWKLVHLFGFLIIGLIFTSLFRKKTLEIIDQIKKTPWKNIGFGIIYFFITPIILLLLIALLIGMPLAFIGGCLYFILLYLSQLFVGMTIGIKIDKKIRKPKEGVEQNLIWPMSLGMIILIILFSVPYLGFFFKLIIIWIGLGGTIESVKIKMQKSK